MLINIKGGVVVLIDDADYPLISGHEWQPMQSKRTTYARCSIGNRTVRMHRLIMAAKPGIQVDHRNGNGLDNRRENLRLATSLQNGANKRTKGPASGFKGVYRTDRGKRWKAIITVGYKRQHLGCFDTAQEAAAAYDKAALEQFGEFACPNSAGRLLDGKLWDQFPAALKLEAIRP